MDELYVVARRVQSIVVDTVVGVGLVDVDQLLSLLQVVGERQREPAERVLVAALGAVPHHQVVHVRGHPPQALLERFEALVHVAINRQLPPSAVAPSTCPRRIGGATAGSEVGGGWAAGYHAGNRGCRSVREPGANGSHQTFPVLR